MVPTHREKENTWAFTKGFTLLVKPVQAWKAEDQEAKEKSHTMDRQREQAQVSSGSWRIRRKHWRFNRAWSCLAPGGQRQPLVQTNAWVRTALMWKWHSDYVTQQKCVSLSWIFTSDSSGWMKGIRRETRLAKKMALSYMSEYLPTKELCSGYLSVSSETGA